MKTGYVTEAQKDFVRRNRRREDCPDLTPEFIEKAKRKYFSEGGTITRLNRVDAGRDAVLNQASCGEEFLRQSP